MNRSNSKRVRKRAAGRARSTQRKRAARKRGPHFRIFISHTHEEAGVAEVLRVWLQAAFPGRIAVFVSSDYEENPLGKRWLDTINRAMYRSRLLITLVSPRSWQHSWIHLEAGWAHGQKIDILPLCHSGLHIADLPRPYSDYSGTEVERNDFARRLLMALKRYLGLDHSLPDGMLDGLTADVRKACARISPPSDGQEDRPKGRKRRGKRPLGRG